MSLFGIFGFCGALYSYNFVSDAAYEATRYALVCGSACSGFTDCNITSAQLQTYVRNLGYPSIIPSNLTAAATWFHFAVTHVSGLFCNASAKYAQFAQPLALQVPSTTRELVRAVRCPTIPPCPAS
jgi:hypothetical protein